MQQQLSFKYGFAWGLSTFLLHMIGGICVVAQMAHNAWWYGLILALSIVALQAVFIGLLFWVCGYLSYHPPRLCAAVITLFLTIVWIDQYCLCMFDVVEGYPLMHPLIVLTHKPALLWLLPIIGKNCFTILFLLLPTTVVAVLVFRNRYAMMLFGCALLPWIISMWHGYAQTECPAWVQHITAIPYMMVQHSASSESSFAVAMYDINTILNARQNYCMYVLPESSVYVRAHVAAQPLQRNKYVLFGATCMRDNACYNVLYWIKNGTVHHCFEKRHAMLLSERMPSLLNNDGIKCLYFDKNRYQITLGTGQRPKIDIEGVGSFVPYICSELFFAGYPDDEYNGTPILLIVNDTVFAECSYSRYICVLLQMLTQLKAIQWQREIVYVSYTRSFYVNKWGIMWDISV